MKNKSYDDILIIAPTFHKYEKYCDALIELINKNWPDHPIIYFLSDNTAVNKIHYDKVIRSDNSNWPNIVYQGCITIKKHCPSIKKIILLNEEAFPLGKINSIVIRDIVKISFEYSYKYIYFPCYVNNWSFDLTIDNYSFCKTPKDYTYYTQLGPAIWDIDYLMEMCDFAIRNRILSPWELERIVTAEEHLISNYQWPTVADGLFKDGFVNTNALRMISDNNSKLRNLLILDFLKSRPQRMYRLLLRKMIGLMNRLFKLMKLKPLTYPYRS